MTETDPVTVPERAVRADTGWYAGLLALGLFFIYRGLRLGSGMMEAGRFPLPQILICANYLLLGSGLVMRMYWARALGLVSCPLILLYIYSLIMKYPTAFRSPSVRTAAFLSAAAFVYLLLPQVERLFARTRPVTQERRGLGPPPRRVPLTLKLSIICGNRFMLLSWVVAGGVCCAIAYMLRKAGISTGPDTPAGVASAWLLLWLLFLGVMGYMAGRLALWILSEDIRLLENGMPGSAVLKGSKKIEMPRGGGPLYHLVFEYEVNSRKYHTWMDTPWPAALTDEAREPILYDPAKPENSLLLDELPAYVEADGSGNLRHNYPFMGFVYALVPLGTLAAMIYLTFR